MSEVAEKLMRKIDWKTQECVVQNSYIIILDMRLSLRQSISQYTHVSVAIEKIDA